MVLVYLTALADKTMEVATASDWLVPHLDLLRSPHAAKVQDLCTESLCHDTTPHHITSHHITSHHITSHHIRHIHITITLRKHYTRRGVQQEVHGSLFADMATGYAGAVPEYAPPLGRSNEGHHVLEGIKRKGIHIRIIVRLHTEIYMHHQTTGVAHEVRSYELFCNLLCGIYLW
jgi:hypothetical protein